LRLCRRALPASRRGWLSASLEPLAVPPPQAPLLVCESLPQAQCSAILLPAPARLPERGALLPGGVPGGKLLPQLQAFPPPVHPKLLQVAKPCALPSPKASRTRRTNCSRAALPCAFLLPLQVWALLRVLSRAFPPRAPISLGRPRQSLRPRRHRKRELANPQAWPRASRPQRPLPMRPRATLRCWSATAARGYLWRESFHGMLHRANPPRRCLERPFFAGPHPGHQAANARAANCLRPRVPLLPLRRARPIFDHPPVGNGQWSERALLLPLQACSSGCQRPPVLARRRFSVVAAASEILRVRRKFPLPAPVSSPLWVLRASSRQWASA